jgi:predicted TIM-barrel fold metal-dependent hydrolase
MPIGDTRIIDLDSHLVGDVPNWERFIDDAWKAYLPKRVPVGPDERVQTRVGSQVMVGSEVGRQAGEKPNWVRPEDLTPEGRVRLQDRAGIDVAVLSPNSPAIDLVWFPDDPKLAAAFARAQNNYMAYFASELPDRLRWAGLIPWQDRDLAIEELNRTAASGMTGLNFKAVPIQGREWSDPYYDPIYSELERLGLPIIVHETKTGSIGQERFADNFFFSHMVGRVLEAMVGMMVFICGGVLERHPNLKLVVLETGASQIPWWLARMDEHYEKLPFLVPWLQMKPSDYFRRQVYVGCEPFEDPLFELAVDLLGDDNLVLATDTPHWDSALPEDSIKPVLESERLSDATKAKVLGGNAARFLNL